MKRVFFLLIILLPVMAFSQYGMPDYWTVLNKFFSLYLPDETSQTVLRFARKKDGWYVQLIEPYKNDKVASDQIFWSKQKGRYQVLANFLGTDKDPAALKALRYLSAPGSFSYYSYSRCVYYGYNEWDADIIKDFGQGELKNDTLLEGLARAYSLHASRYLWYQYGGDTIDADPLQTMLGRTELPNEARVQKVVENINNSAKSYQKLYDRNKKYETYVGNIDIKLFNEYCHGYLQLLIANKPAEAAKFLEHAKLPYDDSVAGQNKFKSTKENSIIFASGDIDTYVLMYLQAKHNIRKDVAVINTNMLGLPAYVEYLRRNNIVAFSTPKAEIAKKDLDASVFYSSNSMPKKRKLADFIAQYSKLDKWPTEGNDSVRAYDITHLYSLYQPDTFQIELGTYLTMNDYLLLDIVNENLEKRHLYFTEMEPSFFSKYVSQEGILNYLMVRQPPVVMTGDMARIQLEYARDLYVPPFTNYSELSDEDAFNTTAHLNLYLPLIDYASRSNDKALANELIKKCFDAWQGKTPFISPITNILPVLYNNSQDALAEKLIATYVNNILRENQLKLSPEYYSETFAHDQIALIKPILESHGKNTSYIDGVLSKLQQ